MSPAWIVTIGLVSTGFLSFVLGFMVGGTCGRKSIASKPKETFHHCKDCPFRGGTFIHNRHTRSADWVPEGLCFACQRCEYGEKT